MVHISLGRPKKLTSYYRKFVPQFSDMARPLTKLLAHDCKFVWSNQCDISFQMLTKIPCVHASKWILSTLIQLVASINIYNNTKILTGAVTDVDKQVWIAKP